MSNRPDVDFLRDHAPVGVVVVWADDVEVVDVSVDQVVQLALSEDVVVAVVDQGTSSAFGIDWFGWTAKNHFTIIEPDPTKVTKLIYIVVVVRGNKQALLYFLISYFLFLLFNLEHF